MNRFNLFLVVCGLMIAAGCSTSGTPATAPSTNPSRPSEVRKLTVKAPNEKTIHQNGTADADFSVSREHFSGPVVLEFPNLPPGISVVTTDLTIPAGKDSIKVTFKAAPDAKIANDEMVKVGAKAKDERDLKEDFVDFKMTVKGKE